MDRVVPWLGVLVAALLAGILGAAPTMALVLSFSLIMMLPMIFGVAAMFAGLVAAWAGNLLAPDGSQSRLLRIVGVSELSALIMALLSFALVLWLQSLPAGAPPIFLPIVLAGTIVVAATSAFGAWRYRKPRKTFGEDGLVTLGLLGATAMAVIWLQGLAFFLGQFGL